MNMLINPLYFQATSATNPLKEAERAIFGTNAFAALAVSIIGGAYLGATAGEVLVRISYKSVGDEDICKRINIALCKGLGGGLGACAGFFIAATLTADAVDVA